MYSVIIPTMWKQNISLFKETLAELEAEELVNEIILIDNDTTSSYISEISSNKLRYVPQTENIYVNPAWNLGIELATSEYVMVLNDDVWCTPSIRRIFTAHQAHFDKDNGIYGLSTSCFLCEDMTEAQDKNIEFVNTEGRGTGWGCLFLLKKTNWTPIPYELKVWFGDDFITTCFTKAGNIIYSIKNVCITEWSITSRLPMFSPITENDRQIYFSKYSN